MSMLSSYSVGLPVSIQGYTSTSCRSSVGSTLLFLLPRSPIQKTINNMSKIKAHVAISLDGYIAHTDGETNWIPRELAKEISEIHQASEMLLTGSNTYNAIFEQCGGSWPYRNTYVISHYDSSPFGNENLQFLFDEPIEKIGDMKEATTGDITVIGGGKLITALLNHGLLDELTVYIVPVLLGDGIRFIGKTFDVNVKSFKTEEYKGTTKISYIFN